MRLHGELHTAGASAAPAKGAIVLVHGFNSSLPEFGDLPARLAAAGYHALAFDQRGYGKSAGEPGRTSVGAAVADIDAAAETLARHAPGLPMGILGHSLGGAYAIAALGRTKHFAAGVAAHPLDRLFDELAWYEQVGYHVVGRAALLRMALGQSPGTIPYKLTYESLFVSPEAARKARADGFLLGRVSLGNYQGALTMSASAWAKEVRQPVLVIGSEHDKAVRPAHTRKVYEALAGPKEFLAHGGGHSCFRDLEGDRLAQACVAWFDRRLKPTAPASAAKAAP